MLTAGCTCLYTLMHGHRQHFHSDPFQRCESHFSVLTAAMQGWFWIWISSVNHIIAGDLGLLQAQSGCACCWGSSPETHPRELCQAKLSFVKYLKHVVK